MPGVRRRLRDVQKKVSAVLAGPRDEPPPPPPPATDEQETRTVSSPPELDQTANEGSAPPQTAAPDPAVQAPVAVDEVCAAAVELARAVAVEVGGASVGDHLGVEADGERVVTHSFATREAGYVGWRWDVTVTRAQGAEQVTVDEVVLLPGGGALLAPAWVPWSERVQPGDLTPGDLLPPLPDDPRLVPSYADVDAEELPFALHRELGLGRPRVLSRDGRADAADRWYDGDAGPDSPMAKAAPGRCGDCGFLTPLAGELGRLFGACANAMAPDDGRVVAVTHGCGAHSETVVEVAESSYAGMAVEDEEFEVVDRSRIVLAGDVAGVADVDGEEALPDPDAVGVELPDGVAEADGDDVLEADGVGVV